MSIFDAFRYDGKRVLVVGGATGMGAAAAELVQDAGAEVVVMDFAEVTLAGAKSIHVDLADRSSIDAAMDECGGPVDVLMSCAGVADGTPGIESINFIGHRHLIDRLIAGGMLGPGSAIGFISSAAGLGWEANLPQLQELLETPDFDSAVGWVEEHGKADYMSSKQAVCAYVASQAFPLLKQGIRINAICPGPTETPWPRPTRRRGWPSAPTTGASSGSRHPPLEQAYPLVFLCSDAACGHHRDHHGHRRRLHELGHHRLLPGATVHRQPAAQPRATLTSCCRRLRPASGG